MHKLTQEEMNDFTDTIVNELTSEILDTAINSAIQSYTAAVNAGLMRSMLHLLTFPSYLRQQKALNYVYGSHSEVYDDPKVRLQELLNGQGRSGLHSFKFILLQELSIKMFDKDISIQPIRTIYGGPLGNSYIISHEEAAQMVKDVSRKLADSQRELKPLEKSKITL
jgi:hypothetical protein